MLYNAANSTTLCATSISLNEHQLKGVDEKKKKKGGQQFDASAASSTCVGQEGDR